MLTSDTVAFDLTLGLMIMTFESTCSKEEEVVSDVDGPITRTEVLGSGVNGSGVGVSITNKCVRANATLDRSGISTDVDGIPQWSDYT